MSTAPPQGPDLPGEAAAIAAAMLRFQEPLAHLWSRHTPEGRPVVGLDAYLFLPSSQPVPRDGVAPYLAALPGPAFLAPTTARGVIGLLLLDELGGARRAALQSHLDNQHDIVAEYAAGPDTDRVLLEFDEESCLFPLPALRLWARRYGILVGWNVEPARSPDRAEWRLNLFGGDGRRSSRRPP